MSHSIKIISSTSHNQWQEQTAAAAIKGETNLEIQKQRFQRWEGFGGCFNELGYKSLAKLKPAQRQTFFQELFAPAGDFAFNFCRLPIGANDYSESWYSLNESPGDFAMQDFSINRDQEMLIPFIKEALAIRPRMTLFASPWSPPTWMKNPRAHNYGKLIWQPEYLGAYALYFQKFVEEYRKTGIKIDQVHVQNEPMSSQKFPSCVWSGEEMRDFIRDWLGPRFEQAKLDCEIWLGTINGPEFDERKFITGYNQYADLVMADPQARKYVAGVAYQWAGKNAIQRTHQAWPELRIIQSENECGDGQNSWVYADYVFDLFYHYLSNGASAYIYWNMILDPNGESTWGWKQNSLYCADAATGALIRNPEYWIMKHFASHIRPGAVRVGLGGQWSGNAVAFVDGAKTTIVIKNPFAQSQTLRLKLADDSSYGIELAAQSYNTIVIE